MFKRLLKIIGLGRLSEKSNSLPAPDPFQDLPHPGNRELFTAMKPFYSETIQVGCYHAHPDLEERLYQLAPAQKIIKANAYGFPVMANSEGLVFAWAKGGWTIMIRLGEKHREAARKDHGKINTEYGKNWIEFPAWYEPAEPAPMPGPSELQAKRTEWLEGLRHWSQVSYDESLNATE